MASIGQWMFQNVYSMYYFQWAANDCNWRYGIQLFLKPKSIWRLPRCACVPFFGSKSFHHVLIKGNHLRITTEAKHLLLLRVAKHGEDTIDGKTKKWQTYDKHTTNIQIQHHATNGSGYVVGLCGLEFALIHRIRSNNPMSLGDPRISNHGLKGHSKTQLPNDFWGVQGSN